MKFKISKEWLLKASPNEDKLPVSAGLILSTKVDTEAVDRVTPSKVEATPKARRKGSQLSNPFSTGSGGAHFEAHVQATFVVLMLTSGYAPTLPCWPIQKIKLQGKFAGYETDDMIIFVEKPGEQQQRKLLAQIKHTISITERDETLGEVMQAAWNDFNNPNIFTRLQDSIALITGPLSATDISDARILLEWARESESAEEFFRKVQTTNLSSENKKRKLAAFRTQLRMANDEKELQEEEFFQFLRHFHLLSYDLDVKSGVVVSLIHSLMSRYSIEGAKLFWTRIVDEVQTSNKNAGTITLDGVSEDLKGLFRLKPYETIPADFAPPPIAKATIDWNHEPFAADLALATLIGGWSENSAADRREVASIVGEEFSSWIRKIQELLQHPHSPMQLQDGTWTVKTRAELWNALGPRIFDGALERFRVSASETLREVDPRLELPAEERFAAQIRGKTLTHSTALRFGLAEGLALLGNNDKALSNCSTNQALSVAVTSIRDIFKNADWKLWASLNDLLPPLAEAAPQQFLQAVENGLQQHQCPFTDLFREEGDAITGQNYLTGLLWALESLAWEEKHFVQVCTTLSELDKLDPGGTWANRPLNSLVTILLPWLPQTTAPLDKRSVAIKTIQREAPEVAWKLILSLLPNQHRGSIGSHRPSFLNLELPDKSIRVTKEEYWEQVFMYSSLALELATGDVQRLTELVRLMESLPQRSQTELLNNLKKVQRESTSESQKFALWRALSKVISKHRKFESEPWSFSPELVQNLEAIASELAPSDPAKLHQTLFSHRALDLIQNVGNWNDRINKLGEKRREAIGEIFEYGGIEDVLKFATSVEEQFSAGYCFSWLSDKVSEALIVPTRLTEKGLAEFVAGFVRGKVANEGMLWVHSITREHWSSAETCIFLTLLPFNSTTWQLASEWLGDLESEYWIRVQPNPYEADVDNLGTAIDKMIEHGRPGLAISCITRSINANQPLDVERSTKALLACAATEESAKSFDVYNALEIIKALQENPNTNPESLFEIEWKFLAVLDREEGVSPKIVEERLASDPSFFCKLIQFLYHSRKQERVEKDPTPQEVSIATNVWKLLHSWQIPPGFNNDGTYSESELRSWVAATLTLCSESGHLEVAMLHLGCVLFYAPADPSGFWINKAAAEVLNQRDAEKVRQGFSQQIFNSRGVYWVDPSAAPELALAELYRKRAEETENEGFARLAVTLRAVAKSYEREAQNRLDNPNHW